MAKIRHRIMAIDYGLKRVGLAVTDLLQLLAMPLMGLPSHDLFPFLTNYIQQEEVGAFVIGLPQRLNGQPSSMTKVVERIGLQLTKAFPGQSIYYQDERCTSKLALQSLYQAGYSKKDRHSKSNVDAVSAAIILQSFLRSLGH